MVGSTAVPATWLRGCRAGRIVCSAGPSLAWLGRRITGCIGGRPSWSGFGVNCLDVSLIDPRLVPQIAGDAKRIDAKALPPGLFVADVVDFAVMHAAERDRKFVAGLAPERARLRVAQVVWVGWLAAADQTGLPGYVTQMVFVAVAARFRNRESGLLGARRCSSGRVSRYDIRSLGGNQRRDLLFKRLLDSNGIGHDKRVLDCESRVRPARG